MYKYVTLAVRK